MPISKDLEKDINNLDKLDSEERREVLNELQKECITQNKYFALMLPGLEYEKQELKEKAVGLAEKSQKYDEKSIEILRDVSDVDRITSLDQEERLGYCRKTAEELDDLGLDGLVDRIYAQIEDHDKLR